MKKKSYSHPMLAGIMAMIMLLVAANVVSLSAISSRYDQKIADLEERYQADQVIGSASLQQIEDRLVILTDTLRGDLESGLSLVQDDLALIRDLEDSVGDDLDFSSLIGDVQSSVVRVLTDKGQGSGVIYDSAGYILTNRHVIDGARQIVVQDEGNNRYPVRLVGVSRSVDLAVLRLDVPLNLQPLSFAQETLIGERVIAIGSPLGLSFSVTEGIVSGMDREIDRSGIGYVQTDVPINPGNSGGPLINDRGEIVGITTLKFQNAEGIGFAIPADVARDVGERAIIFDKEKRGENA